MADNCFGITVGDVTYTMVLPHWETDYIQGNLAKKRLPYEHAMLETMASMVGAQDLVLDVGANVGNHSLYLASVVGCQVEAFEPNPELCDALEQSIVLNHLAGRLRVHSVGVGSQKGKARFAEPNPDNLGAQALTLVEDEREEECYDVITLDSLKLSLPVRMIKVDVEGMELDVLEGALDLLRRDRPALFVEAKSEEDFKALKKLVSGLGYQYKDTFNATPTHLFLHESELNSRQGQTQSAQSQEHLREELQATKDKLANANKKYREANERINTLKEKLEAANNRYREVTKEYGQLKEAKLALEVRLDDSEAETIYNLQGRLAINGQLPPSRGWGTSPDVLLRLHTHIMNTRPEVIVEIGSGVSTLVIADALAQNGMGKLISFEHDDHNGAKTLSTLQAERLEGWVDLRIGDLKPWEGEHLNPPDAEKPSQWYPLSLLEGVENVDLLWVDGPPGATCPFSRYPALPALAGKLSARAEVWMDDTIRQEEKDICERWAADHGFELEYYSLEKGLGRLRRAEVGAGGAALATQPESTVDLAESHPERALGFDFSLPEEGRQG